MDTTLLFTAALQLPDPWRVSGVELRDGEGGRRELHITIGFEPGSRFSCPHAECGREACPMHDVRNRVWRHLNFFQYKAFIHAGVPRVSCPEHGVRAVPVPWARPGRGFTLLFEAMVVELAKSQPVADIAEQVGEHDTRLWRFIRHDVDQARLYEDYTGVEAIGIDETSRKGHRYITVVADPAERNVICVVPGKDANTVKRFALDFMDHNGDPNRVTPVTCDMSPGFAKGIREHLPNAAKVIDKFHVIKHANEAVDKVRKTQAGRNPLLRRTKYLWLRNEEGLTGLQLETRHNPAETTGQDRTRLPDARDPPGHLRHQHEPDAGRSRVPDMVLVDDALPSGTHENPRPPDPSSLAGHPHVFRPPVHQRDPRGIEQHHPTHQNPSPQLAQHGPLLHDDLPDLRQARPGHRHHITSPPTPNSERPSLSGGNQEQNPVHIMQYRHRLEP
jgi:hypothetical protein